ncbi:MAG: Tex family protein [Candidatus Fermentibacteraceae bacterium]
MDYAAAVAGEIGRGKAQVRATLRLLEDGATVPFIARYRKERTGGLDEVEIAAVRDGVRRMRELDSRRESILESLRERDLLTAELSKQLAGADTMARLEDLYRPFRPKRKTRASRARNRGLGPLAETLLRQEGGRGVSSAGSYVDPEKGVDGPEDALQGARDIVAEMASDSPAVRRRMRRLYLEGGRFRASVIAGKEKEGSRFRDYFDHTEAVAGAPSHRVLAMRRGERELVLNLSVEVPEEAAASILRDEFLKGRGPDAEQVEMALDDCWKRLLAPSMETEIRSVTRERADRKAVEVFASNLRSLLLAPPLGRKPVMAVDPGYRTGCKVVCLDGTGALLETATIYPFQGEGGRRAATEALARLLKAHSPEVIAVGDGTAGRETESFLASMDLCGAAVATVSESGASVYSASEVAREELPDQDVTVRGAVSIGRRLQDPLAELVKLDPKSIGVGQYQHDVDQGLLKRRLDDVVESCVNTVGVVLNTASPQLLSYVSGLGPKLARRVVQRRETNGAFRTRQELLEVRGLGPKAFQQCAGFLRVPGGPEPLDASAVHPESYGAVRRMAASLDRSVGDLMESRELRRRVRLADFVDGDTGLPTLRDIMEELEKPGRDPRESFRPFRFADVHTMEDLREGMSLPGIVTNVTAFGAFVNVGVKNDGLVHISKMADEYVRDPSDYAKVGDRVTVRVLSVDLERGRISLSLQGAKGS